MILDVIAQPVPAKPSSKAPLPARMYVPAHQLAKGVADFFSRLVSSVELPDGCVGLTEDNKPLFRGDVLFELKATHGFPLDFALDRIINTEGMAVDWVAFIEAARRNKWWDFQIYDLIDHAMIDADIPKETRSAIVMRFEHYVMEYPHPMMTPSAGDRINEKGTRT